MSSQNLSSVLISSFLRCIFNGGSRNFWCGEWGGGKEEGTLAIETVLQLSVPTLTFLHPISRERRKGRTNIKWKQTEKEVLGFI